MTAPDATPARAKLDPEAVLAKMYEAKPAIDAAISAYDEAASMTPPEFIATPKPDTRFDATPARGGVEVGSDYSLSMTERVGVIALCNDLRGANPHTIEHVREVLTARMCALNSFAAQLRRSEAERDALAQRVRGLEEWGERFGMRYPQPHEKYVVVADEMVAELKARPGRPVTVRIVEADHGKLDMTFTEVDDASCRRVFVACQLIAHASNDAPDDDILAAIRAALTPEAQ